MPTKPYVCDKHGSVHRRGDWCPDCVQAFANRRSPDTMTGEERAAEFRWWGTIVTIPWEDLNQRFSELVGRRIWTHEYATPAVLIDEARTGTHPTAREIRDRIPSHVPVLFVDPDEVTS
jgi:hypothetical protein